MTDHNTIKLELPARLKSFNFTFECRRPGPVTVEISSQRALKRPRSQHGIMDSPDTSEMRTQKPPMLARWIDAQWPYLIRTLPSTASGLRIAPSPSTTKTHQRGDLLDKVVSLRKRLRSICINEVACPAANSNSYNHLPTLLEQYGKMNALFATTVSEFSKLVALPSSMLSPAADMELQSVNSEVEASTELMRRIRQLANLSDTVHRCDMALSDLLGHIDSYSSPPAGPRSSTHVWTFRLPPEEQLGVRLGFTKRTAAQVVAYIESVENNARANSEYRWDMGRVRRNDQR
ncbi:hypothetical protein F4604DRAFT_2042468 [Suillus subluteus]|nr:hypothetical protein F4604DRAFT_2042468 [Suillus subluteus]